MANAPPEKQWLTHKLIVGFHRNYYTRCHTACVTGILRIVCRPADIHRIMRQYTDIASYMVLSVIDTTTGKQYPEFQTEMLQNKEET